MVSFFSYFVGSTRVKNYTCQQFGHGSDIIQCILDVDLPRPSYKLQINHVIKYPLTVTYSSTIAFRLSIIRFSFEASISCENILSNLFIRGKKARSFVNILGTQN